MSWQDLTADVGNMFDSLVVPDFWARNAEVGWSGMHSGSPKDVGIRIQAAKDPARHVEARKLLASGMNVAAVALALGVCGSSVYRWKKKCSQ